MSDCMHFPDTIEEFMEQYKMTDTKQVYSNGTEYVPIFRMEQWFEHEKAQLSQEDVTSDTIDRQAVIKVLECWQKAFKENSHHASASDLSLVVKDIRALSATHVATDTNVGDKISKFINGLEEIFADIRERHVDDSVCGLCEYDGAYIGQSGDWCNECPGFNRDDCFRLSDKTRKEWTEEIIKALPTIKPEERTEKRTETHACDLISRQQAIEKFVMTAPQMSAIRIYEAVEILESMPTIQPEPSACEYCHEDSDGYVTPIEKNGHASSRFGMDGWELSLHAKGWHGSAKIKYCPICGRRLTHE